MKAHPVYYFDALILGLAVDYISTLSPPCISSKPVWES